MKVMLLGYRPYDFADKDGRQVIGNSLYIQYETDGVTGYVAEKINVQTIPQNINDYLGIEIDIDFNSKGKVRQIVYPKPVEATAKH